MYNKIISIVLVIILISNAVLLKLNLSQSVRDVAFIVSLCSLVILFFISLILSKKNKKK